MTDTWQNTPSELAAFLRQTILFDGVTAAQLVELAAIAIPQSYIKEESLFHRGESGRGFFIVQSGRIKVFKLSKDGREQILHIFGEFDHFAEVPVLDGKPYPASATAIEAATVLFFPRQPFLKLLQQQPDLAINLLKSFARHLRHFSNLVDNLTLREVPARLASYLLHLSQQTNSAETITLDLSKGQLAARLGTIPETLSRIFAKLKRQGILNVQGMQIQILDLEGLRELADQYNE